MEYKVLLALLLDNRKRDRLEIPYATLEKKYKIPRGSIPRAINELLEKGFVKITHQGGAYQHDKTLYALLNDYLLWKKGPSFCKKNKR